MIEVEIVFILCDVYIIGLLCFFNCVFVLRICYNVVGLMMLIGYEIYWDY